QCLRAAGDPHAKAQHPLAAGRAARPDPAYQGCPQPCGLLISVRAAVYAEPRKVLHMHLAPPGPLRVWVGLDGMVVRRCPTLPHRLRCSTIGAERLSFRVRYVSGRFPLAMAAVTLWRCQTVGLVGPAPGCPHVCGGVWGVPGFVSREPHSGRVACLLLSYR